MSSFGLSYIDDPSEQIEEININQQLLPKEEPIPNMERINPASAAESLVVDTHLDRTPVVSEPRTNAIRKVAEKKKKEDTFRSLKASYRVAEDTFQLNLLAADLLNGSTNVAAIHRQIRLLENRISQEQPFIQKDTAWKSAINSAAGILPPIIDVAAEGTKVGGYSALGAGLMATYLSAGPQAVASPITVPSAMAIAFGAGTQAQAARVMARAEAGAIYWDLINMTDDQGNKLDPNLVAGISQGVGAVNGLAELFGIKVLAKFAQPVTKRLLNKAIVDASTKVTKSGLIKNLVKQYIKKYPKFVAQESGIELGQAIVTTAGEEMTKLISNELDKTNMPMATKEEIISDLANELRTAAEGIAVLGLPFPMVNAVVDSKSVVKDKNPEGASVLPSDKVLDDGIELMNAYDELRTKYISETDEQSFVNRAQNLKLSNKLRRIISIEETRVAPEIFPEKVTGPEQAIALEKEFDITSLHEIMLETDLEVQRLTEEGKVEKDISKLDQASIIASKHQGAREILELKYKNEIGATIIKPDKFNKWLGKQLKKEAKQVKKVKRSKVQLINSAIQLYIDSKRSPEFVNNIYQASKSWHEDKENIGKPLPKGIVKKGHLDVIETSRNLTSKQIAFADEISAVYEKLGLLNLEEGVLRNLEDNYASRMWDLSLPDAQRVYTTFYKDTKHAKERIWNTIVEGWLNGAELQTTGATQNLAMYKDTMIKTLLQRKLFNALKEVVAEVNSIKRPGKKMRQKLFLPYQARGYRKIDLTNFKVYSPLDIGDPGGRLLETEDGTVLKETSIYAPKAVAKDIENLFGVSALKKSEFLNVISKYNALIKVITLALSGFHAFAFVASYYLGAPTGFKNLNIYKAYKDGNRMAENLNPIAMQGIRNGLTVDLQQDWQRNYLREANILNTLMEKTKTTGWIKDQIVTINDRWLNWMFSSFGAGLKVKTFALEYQEQLAKFPNIDPNAIASNVAQLVNADFGGLHLKRLKRSPTKQHLLQLALLAPDWTESNLRTVTGMFRRTSANPKHVRQLHRHFWARIVTKGLIATAFTNLAIALLTGTANERWEDIDDFFTDTMRSWKQMIKELGRGNFRKGYQRYSEGTDIATQLVREATSVNITPIYAYFGGDPKARKYFSIFRHFIDPAKFVLKPGMVVKHKLSMVSHMSLNLINQEDWRGRRYTTFPELIGGKGLVTYESRYAKGTPIFDSWYLSYALSQIIGHTPIGMNNLISSVSGETEYTDSILNTLGIHVVTKRRK